MKPGEETTVNEKTYVAEVTGTDGENPCTGCVAYHNYHLCKDLPACVADGVIFKMKEE